MENENKPVKRKKRRMSGNFKFLIFFVITALIVALCAKNLYKKENSKTVQTFNETNQQTEPDTAPSPQTTAVSRPQVPVQTTEPGPDIDTDSTLPLYHKIDAEPIMQLPELPTGCEITSLAMVLNYWGYDIDKCTLSDEFLVKKTSGGEYDFYDAFIGSPYDESSFGCFAPVIKIAADNFFEDSEKKMNAMDISGEPLENLLRYTANGYPVIVWATMSMLEPEWTYYWTKPDGITEVEFPINEHCMVLTGYDKNRNIVFINDPLEGAAEYDMDNFEDKYIKMKKQGVLIY